MDGQCTSDNCMSYSSRLDAEEACIAQGQGCDAIQQHCGNSEWETRVHSTVYASHCETSAKKVTPSAEQARVMRLLEPNEAFAAVLACEVAWEQSDHVCQTDADCVVGDICENIINRCVPNTGTCADDKYGILREVAEQNQMNAEDPCLLMSRHRNHYGVDLCDARMGPDSRIEFFPTDTQEDPTMGIPGIGLNVRGRHICPARCGDCDLWESEYGAKCIANSDCPEDQFCAQSCWTGNCQDNTWSAVCQPCDYFIEPWNSLSYNDWGSCPPPPPPTKASKCLVYDVSVTEGCRITPHTVDEDDYPTECEFNPPNSTAHSQCIAAGNVGFHFESYRLPEHLQHFHMIRDTELFSRIADDEWFSDGLSPAFVDTGFEEDLWFESEFDFLAKAPGGFSDRDWYVMRWRGTLSVTTTGEYGFKLASDDGSMLLISDDREASCQPVPDRQMLNISSAPNSTQLGMMDQACLPFNPVELSLEDAGFVDLSALYNDQECTWSITCSDPSETPKLTFSHFDTEQNFDFLRVYDACVGDCESVYENRLAELHGNLDPGEIVGSGPSMTIQYTSDGSVNKAGFSASFTCCTSPFVAAVNNDGTAHEKRERESTGHLVAGTLYNIVIIHYAQAGANSVEASWHPPNEPWAPLGAISAGTRARISNPAGCVCRVSAGLGMCSYVEPYVGTDTWEVDTSCKAAEESLAACVPNFELNWPEDTNNDGNQECGCTAAGHTTSTHDRNRKCVYTPGDDEQGPSCTGELEICDEFGCNRIACQMGAVECEFECWPPQGVCLSSSQQDVMCGDDAYCNTDWQCNSCEETCQRRVVATDIPGFEGTCLGICGSDHNENKGPCGTEESRGCCTDSERVIFAEFYDGSSSLACECAMEVCEEEAQCLSQCRKFLTRSVLFSQPS
eukprot:COSAG02_NODE_1729_length_11180_cov_3.283368_6_plen_904_part_00